MLGASRDASAAMRSASPGSTSTRRRADDQSCRVVTVDDHARPARQQLDGVGKGRGNHRPACRDGVDEHAGGHLVRGVVGQYDHSA